MNASHPIPVVMVADITGSASLHQRLTEQEAERAIDRCIKRMTRSIEAYRGIARQVVGDEILAQFPSAEDACQSAIDMHQRIADLPPVSGHKLNIRIALHDNGNTASELPTTEKLGNLMRIAGLARGDQILCSAPVIRALPGSALLQVVPCKELGELSEGEGGFSLFQLHWPVPSAGAPQQHSMFGPHSGAKQLAERLCLRYRGKAFLIDEKTPMLSLGRDPSCKLLVENRRVSRQHARIERRSDGYYLVDTSTNGSFLTMRGRQEILVRKHEALLDGSGVICFGSSANDTASERVEFEHL